MRFHKAHFRLHRAEIVCLVGFATGRVIYRPVAKWLYSFRIFIGPIKAELLWTTGERSHGEMAALISNDL